ncbi:hypothetical protein JCGZ_10052 [Jatropha curcas]|uniref:NAD(P)-binding domain-containing protein n=2 Tax=Jatropha curcas TaxID=180498 RepID=A0A067LCX3_JATCU|nr:hypothetical protein JCGZ_10052 [Jatropha curcas]
MESCSLQPSTITTIPTSLTRSGFLEKTSVRGHFLRFPSFNKYPHARKLKSFDIKAQASGVTKYSSGAVEATPKEVDVKDDNLAFVAGATGRVGSRTVRELLKLGFQVRAGVRSAQKAQSLVQSVKQMKLNGEGSQYVEKLELVECDLEKPNEIGPALGNASVVICCIGASEKEVFDVTGPYRIDYQATKNLIDAASAAKVKHFIMVSSLGTNKVGFPAAILNLFWGVLIWKRQAEEALIASGVPYTIVRPGGMERPTDAYKETHNITLSEEDTLFGGQVSNLQVAELIAVMAKNRGLSYCKVVEVIAETTAPLTPMEELLAKIPSQRVVPKELVAVEEPATAVSEKVASEAPSPSAPIEKGTEQAKATETRPLSPYYVYADLKPPTSPTPASPSVQKESSSPLDSVSEPASADTQIGSLGIPTGISEEKPVLLERKIEQPLSPYVAYADLKPPTSPTPTSPGVKKESSRPVDSASEPASVDAQTSSLGTATGISEEKPAPLEGKIGQPLSPNVAYDDLECPSSPSPAAPMISIPTSSDDEGSKVGNSAPILAPEEEQQHTEAKPRPLSPYAIYDDLKPPTSPIPAAPLVSIPTSSENGGPKAGNSAPPTAPEDMQQHTEAKPKPLSPFSMYEDMKPPTSPSPSPRS